MNVHLFLAFCLAATILALLPPMLRRAARAAARDW